MKVFIQKNAERLGQLALQKEQLEEEIKVLRMELSKHIPVGESFEFVVGNQGFTLTNRLEDKVILKPNPAISKIIGQKAFIEIAKISKTEIEKEFGKATLADCILRFDTESKLVLTKVKR